MSLVGKVQRVRLSPRRRPGDLGRIRVALGAVFAAHGFIFASWAVRVPAVKEQAGASPAALGLALLGLSVGAVGTMLAAGALCRRFGSPRLTAVSCVLLSAAVTLPALARSAVALGLLLTVFGAAYGCLNVAMNSVAVDVVTALRRPVMPGFHAAWSFGGLAGAALGGLLAPHLSPQPHLLLIALAGLLVSAAAGHTLLTRASVLRDAAPPGTSAAGIPPAGTAPAGAARADAGPAGEPRTAWRSRRDAPSGCLA